MRQVVYTINGIHPYKLLVKAGKGSCMEITF